MLLNVDCGGFTRKMTKEEYDLIFNKQNIKSEKINKKPIIEEPKIEEVLEPIIEEPKIEEVLEPVAEEKIKSKKK